MSKTKNKQDKSKTAMAERRLLTLAFETSCDETSVAVVDDGLCVLSNVVASQIEIHRRFGGVVPEVASRNHLLCIESVLDEALKQAGVSIQDIGQIAATCAPGLVGAVMVGRVFAENLALALNVPFIPVNHIVGHIASVLISCKQLKPPFISLVASGGHTSLYFVESYTRVQTLATTMDDACGEAFDKVAKVLGLPYPGGPEIAQLADGKQANMKFTHQKFDGESFSYSGLKTAVMSYVGKLKKEDKDIDMPAVCAAFQAEAIEQIVVKCRAVQKRFNVPLAVCGGVSANKYLRERLCGAHFPDLSFCGDNAAMIGAAAVLFPYAEIK